MRIVTLTLSPAFDVHCDVPGFAAERENLVAAYTRGIGGKGINISRALKACGTESLALMVLGDENGDVMPATLCSQWTGIDPEEYRKANIPEALEKAIADGVFTYADRHLTGLNLRSGALHGGNIGHIFGFRACDNRSASDAMIWGRKSLLEYQEFYRKYVRGCENITLSGTANMLGIRESRRILCDYTLKSRDFLARRKFADEIGRYCYPIDIHIMNTSDAELERFNREYRGMKYNAGESYGIPLRALIPHSPMHSPPDGAWVPTVRWKRPSASCRAATSRDRPRDAPPQWQSLPANRAVLRHPICSTFCGAKAHGSGKNSAESPDRSYNSLSYEAAL